MKFSVGTNWDPGLIEGLARHEEVEDVYAKLAVDLVGGGRPAYVIPKIDRRQAAEHIDACHARGIQFTYLLNASCVSGREFDRPWRRRFAELLDDLVSMGVDRVTVALPYLVSVVKATHPDMLINVSSFAQVNSVERARRFASLGVDEITVDFLSIQRDFKLLSAMARAVDVRFQVLGNHTCLHHCPSRMHHANLSSHASQPDHEFERATLDYCVLNCLNTKLSDPVEIIKSQWIRPEDLHLYEEIGIRKVKLVDRARSTDWILKVVDAYANRRTPGDNLMDILNAVGSGTLPYADFKYFLKADAADETLASTVGVLASNPFLFVDNRALDGFLERVKEVDCTRTDCDVCGVCADVAARAVRTNPALPAELAQRFPSIKDGLGTFLGRLHSGDVYGAVQRRTAR